MAEIKKILPPFRVYREPERGEQFCIFGDPADARDYCAAVAVSKKHADFPLVFNELIESSQFGYEIEKMAKYIQHRTGFWPNIAIERNTGQATLHVLSILNYPNLYRMRVFDAMAYKESEKIGWLTTESTRRKMLDDLSLATRQGVAKIYDREILDQMFSFVVKKGKPQAESGKKDDLVMACFSEDTEVLTNMGWKLIVDVLSGEKIPSLNLQTNKVSLATNKETINTPYKGKMIHFKGRATDFLVTPNHRMVVHKSKGQNKYTKSLIERADSLIEKHFRLHKDGIWDGKTQQSWIIPPYKPSRFHPEQPALTFNINDFFELLGLYISEGSAYGNNQNGWKLILSQTEKGRAFEEIPSLLRRMNIPFKRSSGDFVVYRTQLAKYIKQLIPGYAHEKRIPRIIFTYHPKHLKFLWRGLELGDGSGGRFYITSSKGLCDDVIELIQRLGWATTWKQVDKVGRPMLNGTRTVRHILYVVSIAKKHLRPRFNHHARDDVIEVDFEGRQVCLSLDKNNVMLVRRNGTMMWSGNTAGAWQLYLLVPLQYADEGDQDWKLEKEKWRFK